MTSPTLSSCPSSSTSSSSSSTHDGSSPALSSQRVRRHLAARFSPLRGLTPQQLSAHLDQFARGRLRPLALVMETLEQRDDMIAAVSRKTKQSVARQGYEVLTHPHEPAQAALAERQQAVLQDFFAQLETTHALETDERGGFALLVRQMMDAVGKRYAVHQVEWIPTPDTLRARFWFTPLQFFEATTGRLRFLDGDDFSLTAQGRELDPRDWLVTTGPGLMIPTCVAWMYKHLPLQDWLTYCEKFGLPGVFARTDAQAGSPGWHATAEAVAALANDWTAVFDRTTDVQLLEARGGGELPFGPMVERMDRAIAALWRGSDLATLSGQNQTGASVQHDEAEILENDFAAMISETLNTRISRQVLEWHFGPETPCLAFVQLKTAPRKTTELDLRIDQFLLAHGIPLPARQALKRYGRQPAQPCEQTLHPTRQTSPTAN